MLLRSLKKSIWFFPVSLVYLVFISNVWHPGYLIAPPRLVGFFDYVEMSVPMVLIALCSFTLPNQYEIELSLVCGTSAAKLFFSKAIPIFLYTLTPAYIILGLYSFIPYKGPYKPVIPIHVPDNFKLYTAVSIFVTLFFFFALFCFFRVITRNCYIAIFPSMFFNVLFQDLTKRIQKGVEDIEKCFIDPFISDYILGNTVPNAYAEQMEGMEIMRNAWTYNRIGFFVLGVVLLVATYLLLRREKLHKGFGD